MGKVRSTVENRTDHLVVRYLDGDHAGYEFLLVPLGEALFFDRTHGGLVRFVPAGPGSERLRLSYEYGRIMFAEPAP